jgi:hypothetical protein
MRPTLVRLLYPEERRATQWGTNEKTPSLEEGVSFLKPNLCSLSTALRLFEGLGKKQVGRSDGH